MKRADLPFRSTSCRYSRGPSQWCHIASGHPRTIDASCPTPTDPGGRNRRARARSGGEHPQSRRKLPGPWFSAYLVGKDGTWLQPLHFATAHPIPHTPGGLKVAFLEACPAVSSEVKWVVLVYSPFSLLPHPQDRSFSYGEVRASAHERSDGPTAHYTCKVTEGGG